MFLSTSSSESYSDSDSSSPIRIPKPKAKAKGATAAVKTPAKVAAVKTPAKVAAGKTPAKVAASSRVRSAVSNASLAPVIPSVSPPMPPNWKKHMDDTIKSLKTYKLFPVSSGTPEYDTLAAFLNPHKIISAEQIVNNQLWNGFVNRRNELLQNKSHNLELLSKLACNQSEAQRAEYIAKHFSTDANIAACHYNDNMALLFHCTRTKGNIDKILLEGLDDRVGNPGLLGKGIYFADDPSKSMQYDGCGIIFIFAVLLGDCLPVDKLHTVTALVKEIPKIPIQKRSLNDNHFDSIVAKPGGEHTEYVVHNRNQCCPLYRIHYKICPNPQSKGKDIYSQSRNLMPPFGWVPATSRSTTPMPTKVTNTGWPFYAQTIFSQMDAQNMKEKIVPQAKTPSAQFIKNKLAVLSDMGLSDAGKNLEILKKNSYDVDKSVKELMGSVTAKLKRDGTYCQECCKECEKTNSKVLQCSHNLCDACYKAMEQMRKTMKGVTHTFIVCPCQIVTGVEIGTCPDGTMTTRVCSNPCEGYEECKAIRIKYELSDPKYMLSRTAFLPNNTEGQEVLKLLKVAWDRRLCFALTPKQNELIWNIDHKLARQGGVQLYGYPDSTYLQQVKSELKKYGIEK